MNRRNITRSIILICVLLLCTIMIIGTVKGSRKISEDAVLVQHFRRRPPLQAYRALSGG